MAYRCANPDCKFDYHSMRAICEDPGCVEESRLGCGSYFRVPADGPVEKVGEGILPQDGEAGVIWLCCYCALELEPVGPGQFRKVADPAGFVWRRQMEGQGAGSVHEG